MKRREKRWTALISAAGLSSRMGRWKAEMEIEGIPNLLRELATCRAAGVQEIRIVTGYREDDLKELVRCAFPEDPEIQFLSNPRYAETSMFDSIRIGLEAIEREGAGSTPEEHAGEKRADPGAERPEGVFFFPVDVPLFTRYTMEREKEALEQPGTDVVIPVCGGASGHPVLIRREAVAEILRHDGSRGLRGALEKMEGRCRFLPVPDHGAVMDADTPEEFRLLEEEAARRRCPDDARCLELLSAVSAPDSLRAHGAAVAGLAEEIAAGTGAEEEEILRIRAAGWLHDIGKGRPHHAEAGAEFLSMLGYTEIAEMVRTHMDLPEEAVKAWDGRAVVFLADKLVKGEKRVSPRERFAAARERFREDPGALEGVRRREMLTGRLLEEAERRGWRDAAPELGGNRTDPRTETPADREPAYRFGEKD